MMKFISSKDNWVVKKAIKTKQGKFRKKERLFLVEGERLVTEALLKGNCMTDVFVAESREKDYVLLAEKFPGISWYEIDDKLFKNICDTETPQGIAGIARIPDYRVEDLYNREGLVLLLDRLGDPGNMGTIIRTAWAFGVDAVLLTPGCVDPYSPKVVRATMGGIFYVPLIERVVSQTIAKLKAVGYHLYSTATKDSISYRETSYKGRQVIAIGSEAEGLSKDIINMSEQSITIPINPRVDSLNAAVACAIILNEAWHQCKS